MLPWSIKVTGLGSKNLVVSSSFLVLLRISNDVEMELVKSIHPLDNVFKIREFFKLAGELVATQRRDERGRLIERYQFGVFEHQSGFMPVDNFTVVMANGDEIFVDKAFHTRLITKNGVDIPLGTFPLNKSTRYPKQREAKLDKRAMKYLANQFYRK